MGLSAKTFPSALAGFSSYSAETTRGFRLHTLSVEFDKTAATTARIGHQILPSAAALTHTANTLHTTTDTSNPWQMNLAIILSIVAGCIVIALISIAVHKYFSASSIRKLANSSFRTADEKMSKSIKKLALTDPIRRFSPRVVNEEGNNTHDVNAHMIINNMNNQQHNHLTINPPSSTLASSTPQITDLANISLTPNGHAEASPDTRISIMVQNLAAACVTNQEKYQSKNSPTQISAAYRSTVLNLETPGTGGSGLFSPITPLPVNTPAMKSFGRENRSFGTAHQEIS